eukprot:15111325-Alexandrium_andersonii.AAC.1
MAVERALTIPKAFHLACDSMNVVRRLRAIQSQLPKRQAPWETIGGMWAAGQFTMIADGDVWARIHDLLAARGPGSLAVTK